MARTCGSAILLLWNLTIRIRTRQSKLEVAMAHKRREHDYDFDVPWRLIDGEIAHALDDDEDSEQHKRRRNQKLRKQSIRHYRHATGKWGAALESFKPIWVRTNHT